MKIGNCVAIHSSPNQDQIVLATKDQLKLFSLFHNMEFLSLRTKLPTKNLYSYLDVKWTTQNYVVGGCANGSLVVFNIHKSGSNKLDRIFHEHNRAVCRMDCSSTEPLVLSGSLDSTCRLWDLRLRIKSVSRFEVKEPCRDVCFYGTDNFAAIQDDGNIYKFDLRQPSAVLGVLSAHSGSGLTLSYSNGYLASGGKDKTVKIWDIYSEDIKPVNTIYLDNIVGKVSWKPNSSILGTFALQNSGEIQIWDSNRPQVPIFNINPHTDSVVDFIWGKENDFVLSIGKDGDLSQTLYQSGSNPRKNFPTAESSVSCYGEAVIFKHGYFANKDTLFYNLQEGLDLYVYYAKILNLDAPDALELNYQLCNNIGDDIGASHFRLLALLISNYKEADEFAQTAIKSYFSQIIEEMAESGKEQLAAISIVLLGEHIVHDRRMVMICDTYLKKLKSLCMYNSAARFLKLCNIEELQRISLSTTRLIQTCGKCNKNIEDFNNGYCHHCRTSFAKCSICKGVTKGLVGGCIECGHTAHIDCFKQWFATNFNCPTGCGCVCK
eukprot:NODE_161_length_14984_cov_0.487000.p2 type:complete len:549 gc:universal NODE_161_length_14984_cov_0.487000:10279-11925(+)